VDLIVEFGSVEAVWTGQRGEAEDLSRVAGQNRAAVLLSKELVTLTAMCRAAGSGGHGDQRRTSRLPRALHRARVHVDAEGAYAGGRRRSCELIDEPSAEQAALFMLLRSSMGFALALNAAARRSTRGRREVRRQCRCWMWLKLRTADGFT